MASFGGLNFFTPDNEHHMDRLGSDDEGRMSAGIDEGLAAAVTCFAIDDAMDSGRVFSLDDYWARVDA